MIKSTHTLFMFILLLLIGMMGWYIARPENLNLLDSHTLATTPDAIIENITVTTFNPDGSLAHRLTSPLMKHIPQNNVSLLQQPHITVYQTKQAPWQISAGHGKALNGSQKVELSNKVIIHQRASTKNKENTLRTEKLFYYPKKRYADTDVAVTLTQPGIIIKAIGMQAYIDEKSVKLLHQTRGRYEAG